MVTFIHDRLKFVFIHVPKTGGMTVTRFFLTSNRDPRREIFSPANAQLGIHSGVREVERLLGEDFDNYFSFAFYRNTYDWLFSLYRYIKRTPSHSMFTEVEGLDFAEYVHHIAPQFLRPQKPLIAPEGKCRITRLEPFERFEHAFQEILLEIGFNVEQIQSFNRSEGGDGKSYRDAYTPELVEKVTELYADDIGYFGFRF